MRWFNASNYLDSLRPVYLATKICHIHFETINFEQQTSSRKLQDQFRFVLTLWIDLFLLYISFKHSDAILEATDSILINFGWYCTVIAFYVFSFSLPLWNRYRSREIFEIFENIVLCDRELLNMGVPINHRKHHFINAVYIWAIILIISLFTLSIALIRLTDCCQYYKHIITSDLMIIVTGRTLANLYIFICYTTLMLFSLKKRFVKLQEAIRNNRGLSIQSGSTKHICGTIRKLAEIHDQLSDTVQLFNCCYSDLIAYAILVATAFITFSVFGLIHSFASSANQATVFLAWNNLLYSTVYSQMIVQLILFCSAVYRECVRCSVEIHKISSSSKYDWRVFKELHCFSQQLRHHVPKVSCSFFNMDWILLYTIAGSFTTYLIILVQFDLVNFT